MGYNNDRIIIEVVEEEHDLVSITEDTKVETKNYEDLINLPKINGQEIRGDKRLIDYGYDTISIAELNDLLK